MQNKYFTTSDYNKFTSNTLDAKITQKKLVNESYLNKKTKTLATTEEIKTATKAEQDKIVKFQTYDLNLFIGQSYFNNDGAQVYLIFQPIYKTITTFSGLPYTFSEWESQGLSNENLHLLIQQLKVFLQDRHGINLE